MFQRFLNNSNNGFTLIEVVVSMTIILIIGGITAPGIINYQNNQLEERFVNSFINRFKSAQVDAMARDIDVRVVYNPNTSLISFCDGPGFTVCENVSVPASVKNNANFSYNPATFFVSRYGNITSAAEVPPAVPNRISVNIKTQNRTIDITDVGGISKQW